MPPFRAGSSIFCVPVYTAIYCMDRCCSIASRGMCAVCRHRLPQTVGSGHEWFTQPVRYPKTCSLVQPLHARGHIGGQYHPVGTMFATKDPYGGIGF